MKVYRAGTDVTVTIAITDDDGDAIIPDSGSYRVLDAAGAEIVAPTDAGLTALSTEAAITVLGADNTTPVGVARDVRKVELTVVTATSSVVLTETYVIEGTGVIEVPANSFQTFEEAVLVGLDIPSLDAWNTATDRERTAAMIEAHNRIGQLRLKPYRASDDTAGVDQDTIDGLFHVAELSLSAWNALPDPFKKAVRRAQVVEADVILLGDPIWEQRRDGLMSHSIGEVSQFFRPGKPLITSVHSRTLRELKGFLSYGLKIGRA